MSDQQPFVERRAGKSEWHLDKTVSVTHIFSTIAAISALVVMGAQFNTRLSLVEQAVIQQKDSEGRQDRDHADFKVDVKNALDKINTKLDRLIETHGR